MRFLVAFALLMFSVAGPAAAQEVTIQRTPGIQPTRPDTQPRDRGRAPLMGTASIGGRVTSLDGGLPIRRVQVRAASPEMRGSRSAMTDAEGKYTIANLPAGRYSLMFMKAGFAMAQYGQKRPNQPGKPIDLADGQKVTNADIALTRGGVISGRVFDDYGEPVVDARVGVLQRRWVNGRQRLTNVGRMSQTNDRGEFRVWGLPPGDFFVSAVSSERMMFADGPTAALDAPDPTGFAATYYPGTAIPDEAQRINLTAGQEVSGIDFTLVTTRTVRVFGTALTSEGKPMVNANVMLLSRAAMDGGMMSPVGGSTDANGAFTIPGVAPGEYILQARPMGMGMGPTPDGQNPEFASMPLVVGSEDLKNVVLVGTRGIRVSGKVTFEGATPPGTLEMLRVFMPPMDNDFMMGGGPGATNVTAQGTFEIRGVIGKRRLFLSGAPAGWTVKAVRIGANDVTDGGFEFGKEDVSNVEFVVTNRISIVTGTVKGSRDAPATDYVVVAFSSDEAHWQQLGSRRMSTARPDQNGTFSFRALPPGSYYVLALDAMPEEWGNPELFQRLKEYARHVTLDEGETLTIELTMITAP